MRTKHRTMKCKVITAIVIMMAACVVGGSNHNVFAESFQSKEQVQFTINPSVNITLSGDLTIASLSPNESKDSNIITVSAASNTASGYSLTSTVGSTSNASNQLKKDGTSSSYYFSSLNGTNKSSLSNFDPNSWGYSYSTDSGSTWVSGNTGSTSAGYNGYTYSTSSSTVTHIDSNTSGSQSIQYKIGAKADSAQVGGSYTNVINFIGLAKVITTTYTINYDATGGSGAPSAQQGTTTTGAVTLSTTTPTKTDHSFQGWCTVDNTADPTTCSGDTVKAGDAMALNSGSSASITKTVYAVWKNVNPPTMQNWNGCSALAVGDTVTLPDERDGETYLIGKLADGKCWMLDNLRLGDSSTIDLTPADTNITSNFTLPASTTTGFSLFNSTSYTTAAVNADYKNTTTTSYGAGSGKIGNYYNYCAASAGTYCYAGGSGTGNAEHDICPAGWRMPRGNYSGEYQALYAAYSSDATSFRNALSTPFSGYFLSGSASNQGSAGYFWSSTYYDETDMYYLSVSSSSVSPVIRTSRGYGYSLRCVMKTPTMQSTTTSDLASMMPNNGDSTILSDARDGNEYQITKINGGYWMTQNLRFTETSLTTDTSNVSTNKTLSYGDLTSGNSYTEPRIHNSGNTTTGVWYNFCAAGANESNACNTSGSYSSSYDICPKNWHLPTKSQFSGITSYKDAFSPVAGGDYYNGSLHTGNGYWWEATGNDANYQYYLNYDGSSLDANRLTYKYHGYNVRCVRTS